MTTVGTSTYPVSTAAYIGKDRAAADTGAGSGKPSKSSGVTSSETGVDTTMSAATATFMGKLITFTRGIDTPGLTMTRLEDQPAEMFREFIQWREGDLERKYTRKVILDGEVGKVPAGMEAYEYRVNTQAMIQDPAYLEIQELKRARAVSHPWETVAPEVHDVLSTNETVSRIPETALSGIDTSGFKVVSSEELSTELFERLTVRRTSSLEPDYLGRTQTEDADEGDLPLRISSRID